jgi:hypothetical protein
LSAEGDGSQELGVGGGAAAPRHSFEDDDDEDDEDEASWATPILSATQEWPVDRYDGAAFGRNSLRRPLLERRP